MIEKYQILFWSAMTLCVMVTITFFTLGFWVNRFCYLGLLSVVPPGFTGYRLYGCLATNRSLRDLRQLWGKEHTRERDLGSIRRAFEHLCDRSATANSLDDVTWSDLNMDPRLIAPSRNPEPLYSMKP